MKIQNLTHRNQPHTLPGVGTVNVGSDGIIEVADNIGAMITEGGQSGWSIVAEAEDEAEETLPKAAKKGESKIDPKKAEMIETINNASLKDLVELAGVFEDESYEDFKKSLPKMKKFLLSQVDTLIESEGADGDDNPGEQE